MEQPPSLQPTPTDVSPELPSKSKLPLIIGIFIVLLIASVGVYFFSQKSPKSTATATPSPTINVTPRHNPKSGQPPSVYNKAEVRFSFINNGLVYVYNYGDIETIVSPKKPTTEKQCYNLAYPFVSPNERYVAYIEQQGEAPTMGGCLTGVLKILDLDKNETDTTNYKTIHFQWNNDNQLMFTTDSEVENGKVIKPPEDILYDPVSGKALVTTEVSYTSSGGTNSYAIYNESKQIIVRDKKYYLKSGTSESALFDNTQAEEFMGWSPDGRYALFASTKRPPGDFEVIEFVVDTLNLGNTPKEIVVGRGGAGGDISVGRKWYFDKGFVAYCTEHLFFLDGQQALQLTNTGGGGCHNEEGFVATSPNGEYAFVKFSDRFELHGKDGSKKVIKESTPLTKNRGTPKNLIWVDNENLVIFESTYDQMSNPSKPKVHLYNVTENIIKPLLENAYLETTF